MVGRQIKMLVRTGGRWRVKEALVGFIILCLGSYIIKKASDGLLFLKKPFDQGYKTYLLASKLPEELGADTEKILIQRKSNLASYCNHALDPKLRNYKTGGIFLKHTKKKLMFALNYKVGESTLVPALANISGKVSSKELVKLSNIDQRIIKELHKYDILPTYLRHQKAVAEHQNYFKIMFVRDPYHRLLSIFLDLFRIHKESDISDEWLSKTTDFIIKGYRKQGSSNTVDAQLTDTVVTFDEFLRYILDDIKSLEAADFHWKPLFLLNMPCVLKYDFIGKFETFFQDFPQLLPRNVNAEALTPFHLDPTAPATSTFTKYWSQILPATLRQVEISYAKDFEMFQYDKQLINYFA